MLKTCSKEKMEHILSGQPEGKNTRFLNAAHSLWYRFKNYEKNPPFYITDKDGTEVAFVFATYSQRTKYINLYEIVTIEGAEGKGYASEIWSEVMEDAYNSGMRRLKISCTPSSVTWHYRNGLVFWAVDPSGSLRSDQPLCETREEQIKLREQAIDDPSLVMPADSKVIENLRKEDFPGDRFKINGKKYWAICNAIDSVGEAWMRPHIMKQQGATLSDFFEE